MNYNELLSTVGHVHHAALRGTAKVVNQLHVLRNWTVGYLIVEFEQHGEDRATYGERMLKNLCADLASQGMTGLGLSTLKGCRSFSRLYPQIGQMPFGLLPSASSAAQQALPITLFEEKHVRRAWNKAEEKWYFAIVNVIAILTESVDAPAYWRKFKERLKKEGNETVTNCHALKMTAADGNQRLSDVANDEALLRLIQTIPSPKAEPLRITRKQAAHLPTQFPLKLGIIKRTNRCPAREQLMKLPSREASEFHRFAKWQQRTLIHDQCQFGGESLFQKVQTTLTRERVHFGVRDFQGHIHGQSLAGSWMDGNGSTKLKAHSPTPPFVCHRSTRVQPF